MHRTLTFLFAFLISAPAAAETQISVASDVSPWFLEGYSGILMLETDALPGFRLTTEFWGMRLPSSIIELGPDNKGEGWQRRFDYAVALYADWHPSGDGTSWHVGGIFNVLPSTLSRDGFAAEESLLSAEFLVRGGYRWFPFDDLGLFLNPWLSAGYIFPLETPPTIGGEEFVEFPLQVIGTVHMGWRFSL